jgi:hypothetical protein
MNTTKSLLCMYEYIVNNLGLDHSKKLGGMGNIGKS